MKLLTGSESMQSQTSDFLKIQSIRSGLKQDSGSRRNEMEQAQALVIILLDLRKTPRLGLGRFSEAGFLREPETCFKPHKMVSTHTLLLELNSTSLCTRHAPTDAAEVPCETRLRVCTRRCCFLCSIPKL